MAHDRGNFVVGELELVDQPGVENDLAAGAAIGVEFVTLDQVDFPLPVRRIRAKVRCLGDQTRGDGIDPPGIAAGLVQHAFFARLAHCLLVGLGIHLVDLIGRQHAEHPLRALHTHGTTAGGVDRLTASDQQTGTQRTQNPTFTHESSP
ncbi:hypothetical protein D3C85_661250 [compost metagenome]